MVGGLGMRFVSRVAIITILMAIFCGIALGDSKPLVVGDDHAYPPFSFLDEQGRPSGFNVELIQAVADVLGWELEIKLGPWNVVKNQLKTGELDVVLGMAYSSSREENYGFSTRHSVTSGDVFTRLDIRVGRLEELRGKRVVVQRDDIIHEYLAEQDLDLDFVFVDNVPDALRLVSSGTENFAAVNFMPGYYSIHQFGLDNLRSNNLQLSPVDYSFAVQKDSENLKLMLNQGLNILKATGKYDEIYGNWLGVYEQKEIFNWQKGTRILLSIVVLILIWALILQYVVRLRTYDLRQSNYRLSQSKAELGYVNEELQATIAQLTATTDQVMGQYSQLQRVERALSEEKDLLRTTLLSVGEGIVVTDCSGTITMMNPVAQRLTNWNGDYAIGQLYHQLFPEEHAYVVEQVIYTEQVMEVGDLVFQTLTGERIVAITIAPILDQKGFMRGTVSVMRDITEETLQKREIEFLSFHDHLTGLYNRRGYARELANYDRAEALPLVIVVGDVNGLKLINDVYGHVYGDQLLVKTANILRYVAPEPNLVARLGGDEFVLILPQTDSVQGKEIVREIKRLTTREQVRGVAISIALGLAIKEDQEQDILEIFNLAEKRMYQDKYERGDS